MVVQATLSKHQPDRYEIPRSGLRLGCFFRYGVYEKRQKGFNRPQVLPFVNEMAVWSRKKAGAHHHHGQRQRILPTHQNSQGIESGDLFLPPLPFLGERAEWEHQRTHPPVFPQTNWFPEHQWSGDTQCSRWIESPAKKNTWLRNAKCFILESVQTTDTLVLHLKSESKNIYISTREEREGFYWLPAEHCLLM